MEYATLSADIVGIFDPTATSDAVGGVLSLAQGDILGAGLSIVGMIPYVGDLGKLGKIAKVAPRTARSLETLLRHGDNLAGLGRAGLEKAFSISQVAKARKVAIERVNKALVDARRKKPNCKDCKKLVDEKGTKRQLQLSDKGGTWKPLSASKTGTRTFEFDTFRKLLDGSEVKSIDFVKGGPDVSQYRLKKEIRSVGSVGQSGNR